MSDNDIDARRRRFLTGATSVIGGVGVVCASVPFIASFQPSAKAKAVAGPVEVDISKLEPGQRIVVKWRGQPVWIVRRTPAMMEALTAPAPGVLRDPDSKQSEQPAFAVNAWRSLNPDFLILVGLCTHLGCSPTFVPEANVPGMDAGWAGGFFCPCHGSKFDMAGRVFTGVPAPTNMLVPPYRFVATTRVIIGEETGASS